MLSLAAAAGGCAAGAEKFGFSDGLDADEGLMGSGAGAGAGAGWGSFSAAAAAFCLYLNNQ